MNSERERSLINARRACLLLVGFASGENKAIILREDEQREMIADLIEEFGRLDQKEQRQIKAGKKGAAFGKLGGRPRQ